MQLCDNISRLYLRPVEIIQKARKMFEALGLMEWVQQCNYILNEEPEISNQQIEIVQVIAEGNRNYSKGDYNSAIQLYNKALDINPNNLVAQTLLRSASLQRSEKQEKRIKYYTSEGKPVYE